MDVARLSSLFSGVCYCFLNFAHRLVVLHVLATSFLPWLSSFSGSPNFSVFPSLFFPFAGLFRGSDNCWQHSRHAQSWSGFEMLSVVLVAVELLLLRQECKAKSSKLERGWGRARRSVSPRPPQLLCYSSPSSSSSWWWCWCWWWWWWRWWCCRCFCYWYSGSCVHDYLSALDTICSWCMMIQSGDTAKAASMAKIKWNK